MWVGTLIPVALLSGCNDSEGPAGEEPAPWEKEYDGTPVRTVLVYAIGSNNLSEDLKDDRAEMLEGLKHINLNQYNWLIYRIFDNDNIKLEKVTRVSRDSVEFQTIKEYPNNPRSTDPRRIKEVIDYAFDTYPAESYGLVFWAHGSSWSHADNEHWAPPVAYAYGGDVSIAGDTDWTNLDELASAIPDNKLDFIWFDNCYMSSIEVMYQMRNKAKWFVGYPTEIYSPGSPYDETIPLLMKQEPDIVGAAKACFEWYNKENYAVTVCVADLSKIEGVAEQCKLTQKNFKPVSVSGLMTYSRGSLGPYYDLGQYMRRVAENAGSEYNAADFQAALDEMVVYKAHSAKLFTGVTIKPENYSGINVHAFGVSAREDDEYYKTLDWYQRSF